MSNAAKLRKKAAEFEVAKQTDRAIAVYVQAINASEAQGEDVDVALLNKVGDLALRQGRVADAVTYYERAVEHYANAGLFNNAIALCNKLLRSAPGRSNVYFTLGRICARKGLRSDATRNFLEYATRMQHDGRVDEGMRALAEVADLMPELVEIRRLVDEHAARAGITLQRRGTPLGTAALTDAAAQAGVSDKSANLVFLDVEYEARAARATPPQAMSAASPVSRAPDSLKTQDAGKGSSSSLDEFMLFDPETDDSGALELDDEAAESLPEPVLGLTSQQAAGAEELREAAIDVEGTAILGSDVQPVPVAAIDSRTEEAVAEPLTDVAPVVPVSGLVSSNEFGRADVVRLDGLTSDEFVGEDAVGSIDTVPRTDAIAREEGLTSAIAAPETIDPEELPGLVRDDFDLVGDEATPGGLHGLEPGSGQPGSATGQAGGARPTQPGLPALHFEPVPELDAAIAAGEAVVAEHEGSLAHPEQPARTASAAVFRLDPHNFILPGELPPLVLDDAVVDAGLSRAETAAAPASRAVSVTPSVPIAAVAAEANAVAQSRRDSLRAAVGDTPRDWLLRRRLAEALFEAGERDAALAELETALAGFVESGELDAAAELADQLVLVARERVPYHQKRVELAVRLHDNHRLRDAYLDLADALLQSGDEGRARAVYARVLEIDPNDDRARSALGASAPPVAAARPDDEQVGLADWLRDDDAPASTRMRMKEPTATGDEQADFDLLLRHFKEGVARSLGEEDYESHYDLGVAFKEMGLLDDAVAEFQKALRSRSHRLAAYEALGQCFVEQERYQVAATVLSRAMHEPGLSDEQRVGVLYLLAYSSEALQRWDEARSYYQRVYATDINFRDVAARLGALEQPAS